MTHDELLARLSEKAVVTETFNNRAVARALRAVVELHKPEPRLDETLIRKKVMVCGHCWINKSTWEQAYRYVYPCPTIQAIEKELL